MTRLIESLRSDGIEIEKKYDNLYEINTSEIPTDIQVMINNKEKGLVALIKFNSNFGLNKNNIISEIKSTIFGKLNRVDSLPFSARTFANENTILYKLTIESSNGTKTLKKIKNDTISIELINEKTLQFVKQPTE